VQNGLVINESFVPSPKLNFPGLDDLMKRYQAKAPELKTDSIRLRFSFRSATPTDNPGPGGHRHQEPRPRVLAKYIPQATASRPWFGELSFGKDGEWSKPRMVLDPVQNIAPNNADQFKTGDHQPILWPPEYKEPAR